MEPATTGGVPERRRGTSIDMRVRYMNVSVRSWPDDHREVAVQHLVPLVAVAREVLRGEARGSCAHVDAVSEL